MAVQQASQRFVRYTRRNNVCAEQRIMAQRGMSGAELMSLSGRVLTPKERPLARDKA
jgi:hypothetical protein